MGNPRYQSSAFYNDRQVPIECQGKSKLLLLALMFQMCGMRAAIPQNNSYGYNGIKYAEGNRRDHRLLP